MAERLTTIRRAVPGDAAALAELGARTFRDAFEADNTAEDMALYLASSYGPDLQSAELRDAGIVTLLAEDENRLAGYSQLREGPAPDYIGGPKPIELWRFYVARAWQGRGVAQRLMAATLEAAAARGAGTVWLSVWERNHRAQAFYRKSGFEDRGERPFILGTDRQTDRVMALALLGALLAALLFLPPVTPLEAQERRGPDAAARLETLKDQAVEEVDARAVLVQRVVDQVFSFGELGFQEVETSRYLVGLLRAEGFTVDTGVAGIPTAWVARWGQGRPVIALGSDIDGIPQASQVPGVACRLPLVEGAPGHGEGHNSGQAVNLAAALAVKRIMQREKLSGTLVLWPGVAEEQVAGKAFLVRAGVFRDVDVVLFSHVGTTFGTSWGLTAGSGLVSVLYRFGGKAAHAAGRPWQGRSALDAVELMDIGWNFRREHLPLKQRSHSVIVDGGDQPNVVPQSASVWYYLRELDYKGIKALWAVADSVAEGAALMTGTTLLPTRVLGAAWPRHYNRPVAQAMAANIKRVGMPAWTSDDQAFARAVQRVVGQPDSGLKRTVDSLAPPVDPTRNMGGPSDDIGDVSWTVPTVVLYYPANVDGLPGHHWSSAMGMATPIAHKGSVAGAKAAAMTMLDLLLRPALVDSAGTYFREVQTREIKYEPLIRPDDQPPVELNREILERYRPAMRGYYYDAKRHHTYLEQLGVTYPTLPDSGGRCRVSLRPPRTGAR